MITRKIYVTVLFEILLITGYFDGLNAQGSSCKENDFIGPEKPGNFDDEEDQDKGFGYVVYEDPYVISCCGTVRKWEFSNGDTGPIEFQVWRPVDKKNEKFLLVGVNEYDVKRQERKAGYVDYDVEKDFIPVQDGDVIGWYAPEDSLVEYSRGTGYNAVWKLRHDASVKNGTIVDFSEGNKQFDRTFGIQATLAPNTKPEFDLLLATSVRMDAEVGTVIYTVFVKDEDPGDKETLVLEMMTKNDFFAFDPKTGRLTVATDMTVPETGQTFDIEFKVTDRCGDETTDTLRIIVNYVQRQTLRPTAITEEAEATSPEMFTTEKEKDKDNTPQTFSTTFTTTFLDEGKDDEKDKDDKDSDEGGETMKETGKDKPLGPGIIAGVAVAIVVVVIIIVVAIACIACKKTKAKTSPDSEKAGDYPDSKPVINGTREPAK